MSTLFPFFRRGLLSKNVHWRQIQKLERERPKSRGNKPEKKKQEKIFREFFGCLLLLFSVSSEMIKKASKNRVRGEKKE